MYRARGWILSDSASLETESGPRLAIKARNWDEDHLEASSAILGPAVEWQSSLNWEKMGSAQ